MAELVIYQMFKLDLYIVKSKVKREAVYELEVGTIQQMRVIMHEQSREEEPKKL